MSFRYFILELIFVQCLSVAGFALDVCEGIDPNSLDPNSFISDPLMLDNGNFEEGCHELTDYNFVPPIFWERIPHPENDNQNDCYASLLSSLEPENARWEILAPFEGNTFVVLSTGGFERISDSSVKGATISQEIYLNAGDTIIGAYFFGTTDYVPFNDYGQIKFEINADANDFPGSVDSFVIADSYCDVEKVGSYESTGDHEDDPNAPASTLGWVKFEHIVDSNQVGPYRLICEVVDFSDKLLNSYYAVDGLRICRGGKPLSDLNDDCDVNLLDYSILSEAWLSFCPDDPNGIDPNDIADPNIPCQLADIYNDGFVDMDDLGWLANDWLYNVSSPGFLTNPILYSIDAGFPFNATLKSHVYYSRPDTLLFGKVDGPDWLSVAPDGFLSGTPLISDAGENSFTVQVDDLIHSSVQATLLITVLIDQPPPFTSVDIGPVGQAGNAFESEGTWTVQASGAATDPNSDECHFVYLPANGDCDITARIDSLTEPNQLARAGVMIRETLSAGSKSVSVNMGNITSFFQYRQTTDQDAVIIEGSGQLPRWVRLIRSGDELTTYESDDGLIWGEPVQTVTVEMNPDVYIGLTATSYDNSQLTTAVITDMTIYD